MTFTEWWIDVSNKYAGRQNINGLELMIICKELWYKRQDEIDSLKRCVIGQDEEINKLKAHIDWQDSYISSRNVELDSCGSLDIND